MYDITFKNEIKLVEKVYFSYLHMDNIMLLVFN